MKRQPLIFIWSNDGPTDLDRGMARERGMTRERLANLLRGFRQLRHFYKVTRTVMRDSHTFRIAEGLRIEGKPLSTATIKYIR